VVAAALAETRIVVERVHEAERTQCPGEGNRHETQIEDGVGGVHLQMPHFIEDELRRVAVLVG